MLKKLLKCYKQAVKGISRWQQLSVIIGCVLLAAVLLYIIYFVKDTRIHLGVAVFFLFIWIYLKVVKKQNRQF